MLFNPLNSIYSIFTLKIPRFIVNTLSSYLAERDETLSTVKKTSVNTENINNTTNDNANHNTLNAIGAVESSSYAKSSANSLANGANFTREDSLALLLEIGISETDAYKLYDNSMVLRNLTFCTEEQDINGVFQGYNNTFASNINSSGLESENGSGIGLDPISLFSENYRLLKAIRHQCILSNDMYEQYISPMLIALSNYVLVLPASESFHHYTKGGLFRHSLETVKFALSYMSRDNLVYDVSAEDQYRYQAAYVVGVLLASIFHDIGKVISDFEIGAVYNGKSIIWQPLKESLSSFVIHNSKCNRLYYSYRMGRGKRHEVFAQMMLGTVVPFEVHSYLLNYPQILEETYEALNGNFSNSISVIVHNADKASVEYDMSLGVAALSNSAPKMSPFNRILNALQYAIRTGTRVFNNNQGFIYLVDDKVYLSLNTHQFLQIVAPFKSANISLDVSDSLDFYQKLIAYNIASYNEENFGKILSHVYAIDYQKNVFEFQGVLIKHPRFFISGAITPAPLQSAKPKIIEAFIELKKKNPNRKTIPYETCLSYIREHEASNYRVNFGSLDPKNINTVYATNNNIGEENQDKRNGIKNKATTLKLNDVYKPVEIDQYYGSFGQDFETCVDFSSKNLSGSNYISGISASFNFPKKITKNCNLKSSLNVVLTNCSEYQLVKENYAEHQSVSEDVFEGTEHQLESDKVLADSIDESNQGQLENTEPKSVDEESWRNNLNGYNSSISSNIFSDNKYGNDVYVSRQTIREAFGIHCQEECLTSNIASIKELGAEVFSSTVALPTDEALTLDEEAFSSRNAFTQKQLDKNLHQNNAQMFDTQIFASSSLDYLDIEPETQKLVDLLESIGNEAEIKKSMDLLLAEPDIQEEELLAQDNSTTKNSLSIASSLGVSHFSNNGLNDSIQSFIDNLEEAPFDPMDATITNSPISKDSRLRDSKGRFIKVNRDSEDNEDNGGDEVETMSKTTRKRSSTKSSVSKSTSIKKTNSKTKTKSTSKSTLSTKVSRSKSTTRKKKEE